ncbi:MAG: sulfotransferase domain-containing protein [Caldilineaceae bacterium]
MIGNLEAQQHRRFIKSHLPLDGLPFFPQVQYIGWACARCLYVTLESPRQLYAAFLARISTYVNETTGRRRDLSTLSDGYSQLLAEWITQGWFPWESEGYPYWGNLHHSQTWWNYRHLPNILFVHYNDLQADLASEIRHIAQFLHIRLLRNSYTIMQAVSLETMRQEAVQAEAAGFG